MVVIWEMPVFALIVFVNYQDAEWDGGMGPPAPPRRASPAPLPALAARSAPSADPLPCCTGFKQRYA